MNYILLENISTEVYVCNSDCTPLSSLQELSKCFLEGRNPVIVNKRG